MTGSMVANNVAMARVHQADTSGLMISVFTLILTHPHRCQILPISPSQDIAHALFRFTFFARPRKEGEAEECMGNVLGR
jgi:hypothetical protein